MVDSHAGSVLSVTGAEITLQTLSTAPQAREVKGKEEKGVMGGTPDVGLKREMTAVVKLMTSQGKTMINKAAEAVLRREETQTEASAQKSWHRGIASSRPVKVATPWSKVGTEMLKA